MSDTDSDPLEGAAIGEKRTVQRSKTLHGINFEPREFVGSDREADVEIADVEVIKGGDGECDNVKVTWEAEMMKTLPRNWDTWEKPDTQNVWVSRLAKVAAIVLPLGLAIGVAHFLMQGLARRLTINGEPFVYGPSMMFPIVVLFVIVVVLGHYFSPGKRGSVNT